MARIRSVKPELRTSEVVASWPFEVRYFFVLLWGYLDDRGRGLDVPKAIAGDCYPHDPKVTAAVVDRWLDRMAKTKIDPDKQPPICRYEVGGRRYVHCVNWGEHQKPNRPTRSRLPHCPTHERGSEPLSESPLSDSVPGAAEFDSRGAAAPPGEPLGEPTRRLAEAAAVIAAEAGATPAEAAQLARWIDRERRPRNLAALVTALAKTDDLAAMLVDQRKRASRADTATAIAAARKGPPCEHGEPGGAALHPTTGLPLCPLCRVNRTLTTEEDTHV